MHFVRTTVGLLTLMLSTAALAQDTAASTSGTEAASEPYLQMCLMAAADQSPIYPTNVFPPHVRSVNAVFRLSPDESYELLVSRWIAVDVGDVAPPNTEVTNFTYRLEGRRASSFRYSQEGPMPPGKYRLDVSADGKPWQSAEFTVLAPADITPPQLRVVRDLMPIEEGKTWTYDFVQEGINVNIPGIEPDAEGKLRSTVSMTVGARDAVGTRVETRRNGEPVLEEWWRVTEGGIFTVRARQPGQSGYSLFVPPMMWIPFPPESPKTWEYAPRVSAQKQTYHLWGTVPVQTPDGERSGYVIASVQDLDSLNRVTVERHIAPGIGMVREVVITAFNDELLRRQEMTLTSNTAAPTTAP